MTTLSLPEPLYDRLIGHLASDEVEQVAFLTTEPPSSGEPLRVKEIYLVPPEGFDHQSEYHVALTDEVRAKVIKRAHELGGCLVEVHSHEFDPPVWFSPSDLSGFHDWVPHVRWRLGRRPYVALVFADRSFDALVWRDEDNTPSPLDSLQIDGRDPQAPSGITYEHLADDRR